MHLREPESWEVDLSTGVLRGSPNRYAKTLRELAGLYEDELAFGRMSAEYGDMLVYEVTDFRPSARSGDMIVGVTRMVPGRIGREFYMTRGHIHARPNRPELYYGEAGHGVMLLESPAGDVRTVEILPRTMCYVPPFWIHRSVNVGRDQLVMTFAYPADSGQDYDIIEKSGGMRTRIVDDGKSGWMAVDNNKYRPRTDEDVSRILAIAD